MKEGTKKAKEKARQTLDEVKEAMKINYFNGDEYLKELLEKTK